MSQIYRKTVVAARDSEDGETPTQVIVSEENSCWVVWLEDFAGTRVLQVHRDKNRAIEWGVEMGKWTRSQLRAAPGLELRA